MELKALLKTNLDRVLAGGFVLLGAIALLLGYVGISGTGIAAEQNPYLISGGLLGLALVGLGSTLWISADLQDDWRKLDALEESLRSLQDIHAAEADADATAPERLTTEPAAKATRTRRRSNASTPTTAT